MVSGVENLQEPLIDVPLMAKKTQFGRCNEVNCAECPTDFIPPLMLLGNEKKFFLAPPRPKAVITILCRNKELKGVLSTLSTFEPMINSKLRYPYVFLNNEPFTQEFKEAVTEFVSKFRSNPQIKFSIIPKEHWDYPEFINKTLAKESLIKNSKKYVYGGLESYRFMIRYFSGPFFHHPDLLEYDYYWRVEPDVDFYCGIQYDPFSFLVVNDIKYGFNVMIQELMATIPSLFQTIQRFAKEKDISRAKGSLWNLFVAPSCGDGWCGKSKDHCSIDMCTWNCDIPDEQRHDTQFALSLPDSRKEREALGFCKDGKKGNGTCENPEEWFVVFNFSCSKFGYFGTGLKYCGEQACVGSCQAMPKSTEFYNGFHFWSNFEIADFRFFRSKQYMDYFDYLDRAGGFFYERWGDAPVHSLAVGLFLEPAQVHYFGDIGYRHAEMTHCPKFPSGCSSSCSCSTNASATWNSQIDVWHVYGKSGKEKFG